MGLPTPNLFAGEQNFHSRLEWVSVQDMEKAVDVIVEVAKVWEEGLTPRGGSAMVGSTSRACPAHAPGWPARPA